jgi:hypothetical protein
MATCISLAFGTAVAYYVANSALIELIAFAHK